MSRHQIRSRDPREDVFVGWDRPLRSFFLQVYRPSLPEDENPTVWIGADRPGQISDLADLKRLLTPHAELAPAMEQILAEDREAAR